MIAAFAVLRLVIDDAVDHFHFADVVVPLKIRGIVLRVPQAEFHARKGRNARPGGRSDWSQ